MQVIEQLNYSFFLKAMIIAVLVAALLHIIRGLLRQRQQSQAEAQIHSLRLEAFQEWANYQRLTSQQLQQKKENKWAGTRKFRVDEIIPEANNICSFYLAPHDGKPIPSFDPGQYLTFKLAIPNHKRDIVRCYSLSDTPLERDRYRVTVKHAQSPPNNPEAPSGVSSSYFHDTLQQGDILDCKAPRGNFYLDMAAHTPIVLIGGGVGITPMLSMIRSVVLSKSKRETWLFYGVNDTSELVQKEYLKQLANEHENVHVYFCLSAPKESEILGRDYDHNGHISVDLVQSILPSLNYSFYVCGPPPMMTAITEGLSDAGVPNSNVKYESFGPASIKPASKLGVEESATEETYLIEFAKSEKKISWTPEHGSILDLAEANDISLDSGCRAGSCGTCSIAVRKGKVKYIDEIDAEPESGSCLACMAIPTETLVVDA